MKTHLNSCVYGNIHPYSYSARKGTRKKLWRIIIKQELTYATDMTVGWNWRKRWEFKLMLKCKYRCHCKCSSEIGTCIIIEAGRQAAHNDNTRCYFVGFFVDSRQTIFYMFWRNINNFQRKKRTVIKNTNLTGTIPLRTIQL